VGAHEVVRPFLLQMVARSVRIDAMIGNVGCIKMTFISTKKITSAEFWDFVNLPENSELSFERLNGEIVEKMASNPLYSEIAGIFVQHIRNFLDAKGHFARVSTEGGGYDITDDSTFAPDVAVILKSRQSKFPDEGFNPLPPDFAIEVISPSDLKNPDRIRTKLNIYLRAKIPLLWLVFLKRQEIEIYAHGAYLKTATIEDILDGGDVLPGFTLAAKIIFEN
jgi:Uma2 family endonuclease